MAEQSVTLNPGESRLVSFEAIPHEARTYQVVVDGLSGSFAAIAPPEEPLTHFWVQGLTWPEHFTKYGEDYGRIVRWRAIALLDEHGYDPATGEGDWHFPDTGSEVVDVSEALHFTMPEGWVGAKEEEISPGRWAWVPRSTIIRLFFETDQGWYGFLDDSPWLLNIPNGGTITFQVTSSGARNWEVAG